MKTLFLHKNATQKIQQWFGGTLNLVESTFCQIIHKSKEEEAEPKALRCKTLTFQKGGQVLNIK